MKLDLRSPLIYTKIENFPSSFLEKDEILLCYEINPMQGRSIEPDKENILGNLRFIGQKLPACTGMEATMPAGLYLFRQHRANTVLNQEEWLDLVIEQQKDGLWERNKPENLLYVRFLHEDGAFVTQVFRPITEYSK